MPGQQLTAVPPPAEVMAPRNVARHRSFYEFFAGGGMARAGLGESWTCLFANDLDEKKFGAYKENWGAHDFVLADINDLVPSDLAPGACLAWASFPCQDLSLAGSGAGLEGGRSGTFWAFWNLMLALKRERRAPPIVVLENVCGLLSSNGGKDFSTICRELADAGYRVGALTIDAIDFLPQSRPRLFIIGIEASIPIPPSLVRETPHPRFASAALEQAATRMAADIREVWVWFDPPSPGPRRSRLIDLIEIQASGIGWHTQQQTQRILDMMSETNLAKVEQAKTAGTVVVGTIYRRTRKEGGARVQRAEVRFDDVAGCLRTPAGGSSRQVLIVVNGPEVQTRLLSIREAARLMGLPEDYVLPQNYNDGYHLVGDGVAVPVVKHIAESIVNPLLDSLQIEG